MDLVIYNTDVFAQNMRVVQSSKWSSSFVYIVFNTCTNVDIKQNHILL